MRDSEAKTMTNDIEPRELDELDRTITERFPGVTVRKDLVSNLRGNALVPTYVLEFLLSRYATTTDEQTMRSGVERVSQILEEHYVHREEANLVQSKIREKGHYRVIDRVQVSLNEKLDRYEASFSNLQISQVVVDPAVVKANEKLLVSGIWCMCDIGYQYTNDKDEVPWQLRKLQPVQMSRDDRAHYLEERPHFSTEEWIDLLMQSIGFNPALFSDRAKLLHLVRMVPFVERNYNLVELGPKGTGKSHIYSEFSPHGVLISGGEISVAKLFVNNATGHIGLVGYWDLVAFDEFAGKSKKAGKDLVDIMKNYMANKTFSRGGEMLPGEASMVFVGNTSHTVPYMLKNSDLFEELPPQYHDPAFLDRVHYYIPGWEFEQIRSEMFTHGYGFVVDYLAEILHNMRDVDYGPLLDEHFELSSTLSTRDKDGIRKTFSGLMKLIYPTGEATEDQMEPLLRCAIEGRKRVKDQLCRIDSTMTPVEFTYKRRGGGQVNAVHTLEENDYPELYFRGQKQPQSDEGTQMSSTASPKAVKPAMDKANDTENSQLSRIQRLANSAKVGRRKIEENYRGVTYDGLFAPYIAGATEIQIIDSYIRRTYQIRNVAEFLETVYKFTDHEQEIQVHLSTGKADPQYQQDQIEQLNQLAGIFQPYGINFTYEFDDNLHDRFIITDTGWELNLGRGLDIYQRFNTKDGLDPQVRVQSLRRTKAFTIHYDKRQ